jgi:glycogen(starch) synthase
VPTVTSDLAGFGDYVMQTIPDHEKKGIYVVNRKGKSFDESANQLANQMLSFVRLTRRDRITQRNKVERSSEAFDWQNLEIHYERAYEIALKNRKY